MSIFSGLFRSRDKPKDATSGSSYRFFFGGTTSGKAVTERSAMQMTAVYSCVRILSEAIAGLPVHLYRYDGSGGKEKATTHPLYFLLHDEPNPEMTSFVFRETLMTHLLLWGNAYAQIIRNGKGEVVALYPLMPNRMTVDRDADGYLYYEYQTSQDEAHTMDGSRVRLLPSDVLHIPGLGFDGLMGYSPIAMAKNAIGMAIACEEWKRERRHGRLQRLFLTPTLRTAAWFLRRMPQPIDNVSSVMNAFGMDASEADSLLDALNATGQATGIDMDTLAGALSSNAIQLKEMGLTAQQAAGFMGMVEMSGLDTSSAMMGLKTAMKNATKDGKTLDQALAGFSETMKGNGSETEKLQAAYDLFGSKAGAAIYNAVQSGKLSLDDLAGSLGDFEGSVENTFNETLDPIDQFKMTMNSLKETGAEIGNTLATVLAPVLKDISAALKGFAEMWSKIPAPVQQTIVKIALVAAAIGPILVVVGKIISAVGTIMTIIPQVSAAIGVVKGAMAALNATMLANPIVLIIAAITALVAAFIYLWNTNEGFRQFWIDLWENIKQAVITAWEAIKSFFSTVWETIKGIFETAVNGISTFLTNAWTAITTTVQTVFNAIKTFFETIWNAIKTVFETVFNVIKTIVTTYFNIYKTIIETVLNVIKTVVTTVWNAIKTVITTVVTAIQTFITTAWNAIKTAVSTVMNAIKTVVSTVWNGIKTTIMTVVNTVKNGISTAFNAIKSTITNVLNGIKNTVSNVFNGIWSFISGIVNKLKNVFNFHWELPKIKLPHFSISGSFSLNPPSIPHFSVEWYKKAMGNGMILDSPTIFGMSGNTLLGGGEAGAEAIVGVDSLRGMIQDAVAGQTSAIVTALSGVGGGGDITIPVYLGGTLLDETIVTAQQRMALRSGGR